MNEEKSFKNNKNVFKFDEIPFKPVCDKQTDGPTDQLTSQKVHIEEICVTVQIDSNGSPPLTHKGVQSLEIRSSGV